MEDTKRNSEAGSDLGEGRWSEDHLVEWSSSWRSWWFVWFCGLRPMLLVSLYLHWKRKGSTIFDQVYHCHVDTYIYLRFFFRGGIIWVQTKKNILTQDTPTSYFPKGIYWILWLLTTDVEITHLTLLWPNPAFMFQQTALTSTHKL